MEVIAEQIAELAAKANAWLTFSLVCAWIGFGLSVLVGIYVAIMIYKERRK